MDCGGRESESRLRSSKKGDTILRVLGGSGRRGKVGAWTLDSMVRDAVSG